jgi:DNA-binding transcriptional regulator YhcF (GntR family)
MKIWLSKNSEISVREQLVTQILLGIASGDLSVGEKLPSTSQLARRYNIHANTVSAAYQKLAGDGLIEFRKGSGFFVRENSNVNEDFGLDRLIAEFFNEARKKGYESKEIRRKLENWFKIQPPSYFLIVEQTDSLREILTKEISDSTNWRVENCSFTEFEKSRRNENAVFVALADETEKLSAVLPPNKTSVFLKTRSVSGTLTGEQRPPEDALIAVVSGWEDFLSLAKMLLIAANIDGEAIILRSTADENWRRGLNDASMIICDTVAAHHFPNDARVRPFRLIADDSLSELNDLTV